MKSTEERVKSIIDKMAVRKKKKAILTKTVSSVCVTAACVGIVIAIGFANLRNVDIIETVVPSNEPQPTISSDPSNAETNNNSSGAAASSSGNNNGNTSRGNVIYSKSDNVTGGMNSSGSMIYSSGKTKHNEIGNPSSVGTTGKSTAKVTKPSHINTTVPEKNFCVIRDEYKLHFPEPTTNKPRPTRTTENTIFPEGPTTQPIPSTESPTYLPIDEPVISKGDTVIHQIFVADYASYSKYMSLRGNELFTAEITHIDNMSIYYFNMKLKAYDCGKAYEKNGKAYYTGTKQQLQNFFEKSKTDERLKYCNFTIYLALK